MASSNQFFGAAGLPFISRWYEYDSGGTFTVPSGVSRVWVKCVAGGGGGGGGDVSNFGGGGGGGEMRCGWVDVAPAENVTITVGSGGTAGASTPTAGGNGQASSFGEYISASGGGGGGANTGAGGSAGSAGTGGSGGDYSRAGQAGQAGSGNTQYMSANSGDVDYGKSCLVMTTKGKGTTIEQNRDTDGGEEYLNIWGHGGRVSATAASNGGGFPGGGGAFNNATTAGAVGGPGYVEVRWV